MSKRHFYKLEGASLAALNRLIEFDTLMADFRFSETRAKLAEVLGKKAPTEDFSRLSLYFTQAQIKGYQATLGFDAPPVQVREYGHGDLYRAYDVLPKLAMNPGTSKANFGFGDLFKNQARAPEDRIAIYTAYEDYKGAHFAPPGAVKLTDEQFASYEPEKDSFEYYRTYDEGTVMPKDFDPARHQTDKRLPDEYMNFSHVFLVQDQAHKDLVAYDKAVYDWPMVYQDYRDKDMPPILEQLTLEPQKLHSWIAEADEASGKKRAVAFDRLALKDWHGMKDGLLRAFDLQELIETEFGGCNVRLVPREDTSLGRQAAAALAKVPPRPVNAVSFGFEERETLKNSAVFTGELTGFPYMKIERFEDGDVKLLALRLPPNVKTVEAPESCAPLKLDDYRALAGSTAEKDLPTHVFRIQGDAYDGLAAYDKALGDYLGKGKAFQEQVTALFAAAAPGFTFEAFKLREWETSGPRELEVTFPNEFYPAVKAVMEDYFSVKGRPYDSFGPGQDRTIIHLVPRTDTPNGAALAQVIDAIPYEPSFTRELDRYFGFYTNKGYDLMKVQKLDGIEQHAVTCFFPSYVKNVEPPPQCKPLTREEYALMFAESMDVRGGSPPAPRPEHLKHLPVPEGLKSYEHLLALKAGKDQDGLPLHERTEFSWFEIRK